MVLGQIIGGEYSKVLLRQKADAVIELGELLISEHGDRKILLTSFDLAYGSQISQPNLEMISGIRLEEDADVRIMDEGLRTYTTVLLRPLLSIDGRHAALCKTLPRFFSTVRAVERGDLSFIDTPPHPLYIGKLRSGSKVLDVDMQLDGEKAISHHILIPATTGKGKSNLTSSMLWSSMDEDYCGMLVLDPHDEYFGRTGPGLKDHPSGSVVYYTPESPPPGARTLRISLSSVRPAHFNGVLPLSDPQQQAAAAYSKQYGKDWVAACVLEQPLSEVTRFQEESLSVLRRRLVSLFDLSVNDGAIRCQGVFQEQAGQTTVADIVGELEKSKTVIIDTSTSSGRVEILIGSLIASEIFLRHKRSKVDGTLEGKPTVGIVLEEAPRVLGKEVLERGSNIFSTIAREGRKFKVGLVAITQLPSLIPREILANMNTKIILGLEMAPERQAIIESAAQDLSTDGRNIASLDKGEAIVTSNFARFATPVKIPLFADIVKAAQEKAPKDPPSRPAFSGMGD
ncbi:MAG: ATP-binding protein [archaeon]